MAELATAMPRSGGLYYFMDRSLGTLFGTIGGIGVWLVMILKSVFALIGIGAYLSIYINDSSMFKLILIFATGFGIINIFGAKKSGVFQTYLVIGLLIILGWFVVSGIGLIKKSHFDTLFTASAGSIASTAAFLCVSYIGLTKIASVAEEVKNPEKNIPLGMFLALITAIMVYGISTAIMIGIVPTDELKTSLRPATLTAKYIGGTTGAIFITIAATLAFSSVANAGILTASRYPLALSRDNLFPPFLRKLNKKGTPVKSIILTTLIIIVCLFIFDPVKVAKLASAFQLLMFTFVNLSVIVMRESKIESYDPGFKSPLYPWLHIFGILAPLYFIGLLGTMSIVFSLGLIIIGYLWWQFYGRKRVKRGGAIYHIFARLGEKRYEGLDRELRGIMREKGLRKEDPYDDLITRSMLINTPDNTSFAEIVAQVSLLLADKLNMSPGEIEKLYLQGTQIGATPVSKGFALPHIRIPDLKLPELLLVRAQSGIKIDHNEEYWGSDIANQVVYALFFLVGPEDNPGRHLRILARIAECVEDDSFMSMWLDAKTEQDIKEVLLMDERFFSLQLSIENRSAQLIGKVLKDIRWPKKTLIALIHRNHAIVIPEGKTSLKNGDRLTIIGEPRNIKEIKKLYS